VNARPGIFGCSLRQRTHRRSVLCLVAVVALFSAACTSGTTGTAGTAPSPTTTDPGLVTTTTTDVPGTTTTIVAPSTSTTSLDSTTTTTAASVTNSLAEGSGCTPGTVDYLPDGEWFGLIARVSTNSLEFDLACWFVGEDTVAAAKAEDGGDVEDPPIDFYIRNVNPSIRTLDFAAIPVVILGIDEEEVGFDDWIGFFDTGRPWQCSDLTGCEGPADYFGAWNEGTPYWLTITGGEVIEVRQQYIP
jgi:hypothetical protein